MWRILTATAVVYVCGHPALDHLRPGFLDKPLQGFHAAVNHVAQDGQHVLSTLGDSRAMHYLAAYAELMSSKLRAGK